jgi:hypothetical protein
MEEESTEKMKFPRVNARFVISYRIVEQDKIIDLTQIKNLSLGGMLFTTMENFTAGTQLAVEMRVPVDTDPVKIIGKVIDSCKVARGTIYNTRIEFLSIDDKHADKIKETIKRCLSKKG